jgi:phosphohistidine swiveling domain-containing protein
VTTPAEQPTTAFEQLASQLDDELCTWPREPQLFTRANALDQWPDPITPLTQDLVELPQERGLESAFASTLGVTDPSPEWTWNGCFYGYVMYGVTPAAALADKLPGWNRAGVYADYFGVRPDPDAPEDAVRAPNPLALLRVGAKFVVALRTYPHRAQRAITAARAELSHDRDRDWSTESDTYLRCRIEEFGDLHAPQREPHAVASVISAALFKQFSQSVIKLAGPEEGARLATEAITPLGGVHMSEAIEAMAGVWTGARSREQFVQDYGFRGANEFELASRPWGEDPATLDRLIEAAGRPTTVVAGEVRRQARQRLHALAGPRWHLLRRQLTFAETHMRWRENGKIPMAMGVASIRLAVREAGRRLAARGRLDESCDVFFLRKAELLDELHGRELPDVADHVERRRRTHRLAQQLPLPEIVDASPAGVTRVSEARWRSLGVFPPDSVDEASAVLVGVGGSQGSVTGRARIVANPNGIDIDEGDILVARGTDSAWMPLFLQADAVVVDVGGLMSHACIAAREVGIPCVIDVKHGTARIAEGQLIRVDGNAGTVTLL